MRTSEARRSARGALRACACLPSARAKGRGAERRARWGLSSRAWDHKTMLLATESGVLSCNLGHKLLPGGPGAGHSLRVLGCSLATPRLVQTGEARRSARGAPRACACLPSARAKGRGAEGCARWGLSPRSCDHKTMLLATNLCVLLCNLGHQLPPGGSGAGDSFRELSCSLATRRASCGLAGRADPHEARLTLVLACRARGRRAEDGTTRSLETELAILGS